MAHVISQEIVTKIVIELTAQEVEAMRGALEYGFFSIAPPPIIQEITNSLKKALDKS